MNHRFVIKAWDVAFSAHDRAVLHDRKQRNDLSAARYNITHTGPYAVDTVVFHNNAIGDSVMDKYHDMGAWEVFRINWHTFVSMPKAVLLRSIHEAHLLKFQPLPLL